jgi:N-acetylmuramoyl-L-alanine amidase
MAAGRKIFHTRFAPVSPVFAALSILPFVLFAAFSTAPVEATSTASTAVKRQAASAQFARAEDQRAALNERASNKRTLAEYKQVVSTYRRVLLITPHAPEVPEAVLAVAELYTEMGDRFGRSYYQQAVESYRFLIHDYPASRHVQDALLRIAELQKDQLSDPAAAAKTYDEFLKKYPRSPHRREVQEARAELALLQGGDSPAPAKPAAPAATAAKSPAKSEEAREVARDTRDGVAAPTPALSRSTPRVSRISTSASAESTRVTIDIEDTVEYSSARIRNPDRIFFDLHTARLAPEVAKGNIHVEGDRLTAVRVAQNHAGIVRVVLDVTGVLDYTASLMTNPAQLVIDLYNDTPASRAAKLKTQAAEAAREQASAAQVSARPASAPPVVEKVSQPEPSASNVSASSVQPMGTSTGASTASPRGLVDPNAADGATAGNALPSPVATLPSANAKSRSKLTANAAKSASAVKPDLIQPPSTAQPTRDGQATLTRALGLKIGRIVIDAGHGGHDTGTIGPTGLMEKDLCLDVALRLGKIVQQRLPGADVMYTRSDDTFIPLEERTRIANEAKADLFISIHANSSHDHGARGIETYYLNLKASPDAMEVAARENATAQESVHDLEDLVKRIARSEKIDESREFAADIQESLAKRIQKNYKPVKDRGVRKAPFVVLIGADMPSILTEISFLSNPADEQLLKKPEHRQRVAEGLYQGVASYLQSLNSVTVNLPKLPLKPASRSMASASVEQTRNPQ